MASTGSRVSIAVLLPDSESRPVVDELRAGGFEPIVVADQDELAALVAMRRDVVAAVIDVENDPDGGLATWAVLHEYGRDIPALLIVDPRTLDRLDTSSAGHAVDEYLARPYSAESIRWRVEAMCIRAIAHDDGSGPVLQGTLTAADWTKSGQLLVVFNPKGGVGKTTIAINLAAALVARGQRVLLVDADTVTGHVPTSLGMDAVTTVVDAWQDELEGGPSLPFAALASAHPSGIRVLPLSSSPLHTEILDPARVATSLSTATRSFDFVVTDLHPSYSALNQAVFDAADRILVPTTPDLPAIRAVVKLREVAEQVGMRERMTLIVNRANSGISVADIEKAVGIPCTAQIRSGGLLLVKAVNEGRTLVEMAPREKITGDFLALADRLQGIEETVSAKPPLRLFGRTIAARA